METCSVSWTLHDSATPPAGATPDAGGASAPPAGTPVEHLAPDRGGRGPGPVRGGPAVCLGRHEAVQWMRTARARRVGGDQPAVLATRLRAGSGPQQLFGDLQGLPATPLLVRLLKGVGPARVPPPLDPVQKLIRGTPAQFPTQQFDEFVRVTAAELPHEGRRQRMEEIADRIGPGPLISPALAVAVGRERRTAAAAQPAAVTAEPVVESVQVPGGRPAALPAAGGAQSAEAFTADGRRPGPLLTPTAAAAPAVLVMDGTRIASRRRE